MATKGANKAMLSDEKWHISHLKLAAANLRTRKLALQDPAIKVDRNSEIKMCG